MANFVTLKENFKQVVAEGWKATVVGSKMYKVVSKMRLLKKPIRDLMWEKGDLHVRVKKLRKELDVDVEQA